MKNQFKILLIFISILTIGCSKEDREIIQSIDNHVNTWTDGIIPYAFTENVPQEQRAIILDAMATYENIANVDYIEYSIDDLLKFPPGL